MSGHSKWSTIKRQKGIADAKKGKIFTKLGHAITMAAKEKGGDPTMNARLRMAIEAARAQNMPKDNIDRAIKKGTGELGGAVEEALYEGFGPGGVAILVLAVTDNTNRTHGEVHTIFSKHGGHLGSGGSVHWMFEKKGVLRVALAPGLDKDALELELIDAGASDVEEEEGALTVSTAPEDFNKVKDFLESKKMSVEYAEIDFVPKNPTPADEAVVKKVEGLVEFLEEVEDVSGVWTSL